MNFDRLKHIWSILLYIYKHKNFTITIFYRGRYDKKKGGAAYMKLT